MKDQPLPGMKRSYDDTAHGFVGVPHSKTKTSKEAAEKIVRKASTIRQRVWQTIHNTGGIGATAQELEVLMNLAGNTIRPRLVELEEAHRIIKTETTRETVSGRSARAYVAVDDD